MKPLMLTFALCGLLAIAACGDSASSEAPSQSEATAPAESSADDAADRSKPKVSVPDGAPPEELVRKDLIEGDGPTAEPGKEVTVQYVGVDYANGEELASSWSAQPYTFKLGSGVVIPGCEEGIEGMKEGGRRELIIPPKLGYGPKGSPPNATLVYVIDLLKVT
jgi:FKBP-type peptidyl-prolyl cis-trans isomerase